MIFVTRFGCVLTRTCEEAKAIIFFPKEQWGEWKYETETIIKDGQLGTVRKTRGTKLCSTLESN